MVGEADRELTWVTFTYHSSGPIYETSAQSMELSGSAQIEFSLIFQLIYATFVREGLQSRPIEMRATILYLANPWTEF